MQDQPNHSPESSDRKRARQAARASDDAFKGGEGVSGVADRLRSPWQVRAGRLWEAARRREISRVDD
jgi:hypothetical protein